MKANIEASPFTTNVGCVPTSSMSLLKDLFVAAVAGGGGGGSADSGWVFSSCYLF